MLKENIYSSKGKYLFLKEKISIPEYIPQRRIFIPNIKENHNSSNITGNEFMLLRWHSEGE